MSGWVLAVDVGTSNTAAAVCPVGQPQRARVVELSSTATVMPSGVLVTGDSQIVTGEVARQAAGAAAPGSYEPTPRRRFGEGTIVLGGEPRPVVDLVAEVLRTAGERAARQFNGVPPAQVRLTHPAAWARSRCQLLSDAAGRAGLPEPTLVPEPVAAATYYAQTHPGNGDPIAVVDLGGGTLDVAVLQPSGAGFEVIAASGIDPLGGELFDERLLEFVRNQLDVRGRGGLWERLQSAEGLAARRTLLDSVRHAKHTLSERPVAMLQVAVGDDVEAITISREEFIQRIRDDLDRATRAMQTVLRDAELRPDELERLYLVGGSSEIPEVASSLERVLGLRPATYDDPKTVTCLGALHREPRSDSRSEPTASVDPRRLRVDHEVLSAPRAPEATQQANTEVADEGRNRDAPLARRVRDALKGDPSQRLTEREIEENRRRNAEEERRRLEGRPTWLVVGAGLLTGLAFLLYALSRLGPHLFGP